MTRKIILKSFIAKVLLWGLSVSAWGASLELGQVRANRRGWTEIERARASHDRDASQDTREVEGFGEEDAYVTEEVAPEDSLRAFEGDAGEEQLEESGAAPDKERRVTRVRSGSKRRSGLILIGGRERKKPSLKDGYLTVDLPPALRFSDADPVNARPPSPALPEFNFVSHEYVPYLLETHLTEDELQEAAMLSEIVIEMEPHEVVSGKIKTRSTSHEELVEHFDLEEQRSTVLRPEEVLIFFETDTHAGRAGAMVPFNPATPNTTTIKSSATLKKE
ncbi:hypothetical protein IEN85_18060 [Pelagicoccus sp. NFK12]|uniref:Uncharacterized protein n=1 Tax=Pelagicoccus enzymogenes TaxID=2773457 RepID=A0A927IIM1_9BACT|nr:hypothetical protein [Pelagicoccus enzymogenes]MBD5781411.1 hypothetical protein [Pelagicoccus enzymogenes]